jgi:site-specific DNA-methyltransferase (adenine-specific)
MYEILQGNNLDLIKQLPDNSIDAIVTDPPYGLAKLKAETVKSAISSWLAGEEPKVKGSGFMGASWDSFVPSPTLWRECLRVLKPGGHLAVFAGSRTVDLMGLSLRLAGAEIRDTLGLLGWLTGQGFPKSVNLGNGFGTALKPSYEPILLCRKEPEGTIANNVEKYGVGGMNIDGCRVGEEERFNPSAAKPNEISVNFVGLEDAGRSCIGRFPPNTLIVHHPFCTETSCDPSCVTQQLDDKAKFFPQFFYGAKASRSEREKGCENLPDVKRTDGREKDIENPRLRTTERKNHHPTVKPIDLMCWLCRLVTPPNGVILDPFAGSGSTIVAATLEGFDALGFELNPDYVEIGRARCEGINK